MIGYRVPKLTWCSGECPTSAVTDGLFRLELVLPHLDWKAGDPISGGMAILEYRGSNPVTVYGSSSLVVFSYAEVGGTRKVDPVWPADCGARLLDPATPVDVGLSKTGAVPNDGPDADFVRTFLSGSDVRFPVGTWDITAMATFTEHPDCSGGPHEMRATERISVRG